MPADDAEDGPAEAVWRHRFVLHKYALDRAYELELNRFTHAYEMEQAKLLFILNGAAFALLLGLLKLGPAAGEPRLVILAAGLWLLGLLTATVAGCLALEAQRAFARAYHRRRARETDFGLFEMVDATGAAVGREVHLAIADRARADGERRARWVPRAAYASLGAFLSGGVAALAYLRAAVAG